MPLPRSAASHLATRPRAASRGPQAGHVNPPGRLAASREASSAFKFDSNDGVAMLKRSAIFLCLILFTAACGPQGGSIQARLDKYALVELKVDLSRSKAYFDEARRYSPEGAPDAKGWKRDMFSIARAKRNRLWDLDGNENIDHTAVTGPLHLGHPYDHPPLSVLHASRA